MQLLIKADPNLARFINRLNGFEKRFMGGLNQASRLAGAQIANAMRSAMSNGEWPPNDEHYQSWKRRHGFDTSPLFRTHLLANSISHKRAEFSPSGIRGEIGWRRGMRYPGRLKERIYSGRVPKWRKRDLGKPKGGRLSLDDTHYLADVARWNAKGAGDRPERDFIRLAYETVAPRIVKLFVPPLARALPISGMEEAPF